MKDQSPIPPAPDPCPGKKLKIYLPWEKAGDPPHSFTIIPLEAGDGAGQPNPATGQCPGVARIYQGLWALRPANTLDSPGVCQRRCPPRAAWRGWAGFPKVSSTSIQEVAMLMEVGEAEPPGEKSRSPAQLHLQELPPGLGLLQPPPAPPAWDLGAGRVAGKPPRGCSRPTPIPLPGKGLLGPRPSSLDPEAARGLCHPGRCLHPGARIASPRGSRPARRPGLGGLVAGTGASRAGLLPARPGLIRESWPPPRRRADSGTREPLPAWAPAHSCGRAGTGAGWGHLRTPRSRVRARTPSRAH